MKLLKKIVDSDGHVQIVCEKEVLGLFKKKIEFVSLEVSKQGFHSWKYSDTNLPVEESISYKLDNWCNNKTILKNIEEHIVYCSLGCPLGKEVGTCVFKKSKTIEGVDERCEYIRSLDEIEQKRVYKAHKECFINRGGTINDW